MVDHVGVGVEVEVAAETGDFGSLVSAAVARGALFAGAGPVKVWVCCCDECHVDG